MEASLVKDLEKIDVPKMLGYLNFSTGKSDTRFQSAWNEAHHVVSRSHPGNAWLVLCEWLIQQCPTMALRQGSAFQNVEQALNVLGLLKDRLIPGYLAFHQDLLGHLTPQEQLQPFMVIKQIECLLHEYSTEDDADKVIKNAIRRLNDFLGYRPVATLENKQLGEAYSHEFFCPIPLFLKDVGVGHGPYEQLIHEASGVLRAIPDDMADRAAFEWKQLEEWAYDPRCYDHSHPVNRRPNYVFGEWDPLKLDISGNYRRYVSRAITLQTLQSRINTESGLRREEYLKEAGIVLAGTVLMSSAMSGRSPGSLDSSVKLATLVPKIAKLRDSFYAHYFEKITGTHRTRLSEEAEKLRQPFAGARQFLNQAITKHRVEQLQVRHVAYFLCEIGLPQQGKDRLHETTPASDRFYIEIQCLLNQLDAAIRRHEFSSAGEVLVSMEDTLKRGIECGALADPWNALGFQAHFPIFQSMEDAVLDHRLLELCELMETVFQNAGRLLSETAAAGQHDTYQVLLRNTSKLALWWDQFATVEVSDLPQVSGEDHVQSATEVAEALRSWHQQGETAGALPFWKEQLHRFHSASSFSLVVDVLLHRGDYYAAMSLLINWLSHASEVPLEDGRNSFFDLMMRWTVEVLENSQLSTQDRWKYLKRFFDLLEANAEEYWDLSSIRVDNQQTQAKQDNPFQAAFEGMEYQDSTDDGNDSSLAEDGASKVGSDFPLEHQADEISEKFRFIAHVGQLWRLMARTSVSLWRKEKPAESLLSWWKAACQQQEHLLPLLQQIQQCAVPEPLGSQASMMEYDRHRSVKERLLETGISTVLDIGQASRSLLAAYYAIQDQSVPTTEIADWERAAVQLEAIIWQGKFADMTPVLNKYLEALKNVSLLYKPLDAGGEIDAIYQTRTAQNTLRELMHALPRCGNMRETYQVLQLVKDVERSQSVQGRVVTEFNRLFEFAMQGLTLSVARSSQMWDKQPESARLVQLLDQLAKPFLMLWMDHSHSVRLSSLETIHSDEDWRELRDFIRKYGSDLFHPKFMTLANLRAILGRGVEQYLQYLEEEHNTASQEDVLPGTKLLDALHRNRLPHEAAIRLLELVLKSIVENYEEYKDYNATTTQSDYGENLYRLVAFLRLKATYERHSWNIKPLIWVHESLSREGNRVAAQLWKDTIEQMTSAIAKRNVEQLRALQEEHGMQLRTVADLVEEQFLAPMEIDRLSSLVAPAVKELELSQTAQETRDQLEMANHKNNAKQELLDSIDSQLKTTSGSGLDVPVWIRKLEQEGDFVLEQQSIEKWLEPPLRVISEKELLHQLANWEIGVADSTLLPG